MKPLTSALFALSLLMPATAMAAGGGAVLSYSADLSNEASLQRGARNFMNYCSGCHGLKFLRYNRLARDLGIPEDLVEQYLVFGDNKIHEHINTAMPAEAEKWFGRQPPDLSLSARSRGADWIYSFLNTFYMDPSKPTGFDNVQLPGAAMPHVLVSLQGVHAKAEHGEGSGDGHGGGHHGPDLVPVSEGRLSPEEYKDFTADLANFLAYAAEPGKSDRIALGGKVLFYLLLLFVAAYLMKREFWKDVH